MDRRPLGSTGFDISPIGFGSWATGGGGWEWAWGPQDDADSIDALHRAIELGVNWIDTAPAYGLGHAEEIVGRAIRHLEEPPLVFTKCGRTWDDSGRMGYNLTSTSIRSECEASLERLGIESIDLYQIHWPVPDEQIEEAWQTLADLKAEEKVKHIGVSNFSTDQLDRCHPIHPVETDQPLYNLIHREIEDGVLPYCRDRNVGVIVYSPLASGLLAGRMTPERIAALADDDWRKRDPDFKEPKLSRHLAFVNTLKETAIRLNTSPASVAVRWALHHPAVSGAIVGLRDRAQVESLLGTDEIALTEADYRLLEVDP